MGNIPKFLIATLLLKSISAQKIEAIKILSPECRQSRPDPEKTFNCCVIPELFDAETNQRCAADSQGRPSLRGSPECAERTCVLRSHDLLFDNEEIDSESFRQYLDEWVTSRREFQTAVNAAKQRCLSGKRPLFGPVEMCAADKLTFCIYSVFYNKCPNRVQSKGCKEWQTYMENCMPYSD